MTRHDKTQNGASKEGLAPGDVEYLFYSPFPEANVMAMALDIAPLPNEQLYMTDAELSGERVFVARTGRDGQGDETFGRDGWLSEPFFSLVMTRGLLPREDGGVVVLVRRATSALDFGLMGLNVDGSLDTTFGEGGKVIHQIPGAAQESRSEVLDDTLDASDRRRAAQHSREGIAPAEDGAFYCLIGSARHYALARCLSDGQLDPEFNGTGFVTGGDENNLWTARAMVVEEGRVTLVGEESDVSDRKRVTFWRFTADGSLDESFGDNGYVHLADDFFADVDPALIESVNLYHAASLAGGGIVASGDLVTRSESGARQHFGLLVCLDSSGNPLASFHNGRARLFGVLGNYKTGFQFGGVAVQSDGSLVVGGDVSDSEGNSELLVVRFRSNGSVDSTFGNGGWVRFSPYGYRINYMTALRPDAEGNILAAGAGGEEFGAHRQRAYVFQMRGS